MRPLFLAVLALSLSACSIRTLAVRTTGDLIARGTPAFYEESDPAVAKDAMPGQLKLLEVLLKSDPQNKQLLAALAEGFAGYAFLFVEDENPARAAKLYKRAADYGLKLLNGKEAESKDVPALYWTATALAGWANLESSSPEALAAVPKAARMIERVLALDPNFQYGGPDLFFGVYYAARPAIAGGDLKKAEAHFSTAIERSGGKFLPVKFMMMKHYAPQALDEELFKRLAGEIAETPADALPEMRLANETAKMKAAALMEKFDELF